MAHGVPKSCTPLPIEADQLQHLVDQAKDWALTNGVCMRKFAHDPDIASLAPIMLLPSALPRRLFTQAKLLQEDVNELFHRVAHNHDFLQASLSATVQVDEFTRRLYEIYETVRREGLKQPLQMGLLRSDYMVDSCHGGHAPSRRLSAADGMKDGMTNDDDGDGANNESSAAVGGGTASKRPCMEHSTCLRQVEVNTIASSFGGLSGQLTRLHRYVLQQLGKDRQLIKQSIPNNGAICGIARGLLAGWDAYKEMFFGKSLYPNNLTVMVVILADETNVYDQRLIEYKLQEDNPDVVVIRRTLTQLTTTAKLSPSTQLIVDGKYEVAVVYFRAGYTPDHYEPKEAAWRVRLLMERSRAIKCPSTAYQLAGTKKVQERLAQADTLEAFVDAAKAAKIRECFAGLYPLDQTEEGKQAVAMATENPSNFVLKPQREGGGNNIFGDELKKRMLSGEDLSAFILMDRIFPAPGLNYPIRTNSPVILGDTVSELGVFGCILGDSHKVIVNEECGHLLRSKSADVDEGGVATGFAALDSPFLV